MITALIAATKIRVMLKIVVKKACLTTKRAVWIFTTRVRLRPIRCKLMAAFTALIFLETQIIFAIAIK
jgi:hypothetical protein